MKFCGVLVVLALALALASARPQLGFRHLGEKVQKALEGRGISLEKVIQPSGRKDVGDIWTDCGTSGDIGTIENVTITPDPPAKGSTLSVAAEVKLSEKVTSGSIAVKLQYYILGLPIVVLDDTYDICGAETGLTCPLDEGNHNVKFENEIPSSSPGGRYTGSAVATDEGGKQVLCINLEFRL